MGSQATITASRSAECKHCRRQNQVEIHESITSHSAQLREKLISGEVWKWRCSHCAHENAAIYPLLYHDMRAWCLVYYLDRQITDDPKVVARMVPPPEQLTALRRFNATYRFRLCRSLDDFNEKLRILDAGLDDRAVEYLKDRMLDRAGQNARFEGMMDGETKALSFGPSISPIAYAAYSDALAKIKERLGDDREASSGFLVVDRAYIAHRLAEPVPKIKETAPRAAQDMGSIVFGKNRRFDEARKPWWRFW